VTSIIKPRWFVGLAFVALLASVAAPFAWRDLYPDSDDPKNIDYVLWKLGLNRNMNLDTAVRALMHDNPSRQVAGLSRKELEKTFGYLRTFDSASHFGGCYTAEALRHPRASEEVSLRDSVLIVTMEKGKAVDALVCKGG